MPPPPARGRTEVLSDLSEARLVVAQLEAELSHLPPPPSSPPAHNTPDIARGHVNEYETLPVDDGKGQSEWRWPLSQREYGRYSRQMMLSGVGLPGQLMLKQSHILVVGAGGLGCPVLLYLAAAGVGEISILDHDAVELSNLHRQVLHTEARVGMSKAQSAKMGLQALNSDVRINAHELAFKPSLFHSSSAPPSLTSASFTLVLDCTDNPATRHFLNAYCVAHHIPLVSGGAVRAEGTVGAYGVHLKPSPSLSEGGEEEQQYGPCYACIFPPSPPATAAPTWSTPAVDEPERIERERQEDQYYERLSLAGTGACSDEGVLGVLCGMVGLGMAGEAIKVLLGTALPSLHLFSPLSSSPYRTIKARSRKPACVACGTFPFSTVPSPSSSSPTLSSTPSSRWSDFLASLTGDWLGWTDPLCELPGVGSLSSGRSDSRVKAEELREVLQAKEAVEAGDARGKKQVRVIDTRSAAEFGMANVEGSINIPFSRLLRDPSLALSSASSPPSPSTPADSPSSPSASTSATVDRLAFICRRGNDSLLASRAVRRYLARQEAERAPDGEGGAERPVVEVVDVVGGLQAWAKLEAEQGEGFPVY